MDIDELAAEVANLKAQLNDIDYAETISAVTA